MTRKKKNRKLGENGSPRLSKEKLNQLRALKEQRVKKVKGAKAGSRNSQLLKESPATEQAKTPKDKRLGSKKPISLTPVVEKPVVDEPLKPVLAPQAILAKTRPVELTPEQELAAIESDERLVNLIERHERGELLTGKDAKYFNSKVARHQQLCELLGIDDEDEEEYPESELDSYMSDDLANEWLDDDDGEY